MGLAGTTTSLYAKNVRKSNRYRPPIGDPSICFIKSEFTEKRHSFVNFTNILKIYFLQNGLIG